MAITIDATLVLPPEPLTGVKRGLTAAEDVLAGQLVAAPDDDDQVSLCDSDDDVYGIALTSAYTDQPVLIDRGTSSNTIVLGAATVQDGQLYVADPNTDGGICPYEDLQDGDSIRLVGKGEGTDSIVFKVENTGDTMPVREGLFIAEPY